MKISPESYQLIKRMLNCLPPNPGSGKAPTQFSTVMTQQMGSTFVLNTTDLKTAWRNFCIIPMSKTGGMSSSSKHTDEIRPQKP